jgi:Saxitoxin biosynthesis operon protein SxtJ
MAMIEINWKPTTKELRQFAVLWLVFFGLMGAWWRYDTGTYAVAKWLWIAALTVGPLGIAIPSLLRPIYVAWMVAAFPIGWTVSHVMLFVIYFLVLTPFGLIVKATGHDPMKRSFDPAAQTYWTEHRTGDDPKTYFRQF